jgi:hypothetical protein
MNDEVVDALLPKGEPFQYERQLWDYKLELPQLPPGRKPTDDELAEFNGDVSEIIKDAAAFYNSYGGYILVGVRNSPREIVGFSGSFDCDDLNKRILAATGQAIECFFKTLQTDHANGSKKTLGLLLIPQRPDGKVPAQFIKDAAQKKSGKKPYSKNDIYFRTADQCIRAELSEHYTFLFTPGRRVFTASAHIALSPILDSNLGPRDPSFIEFVGRETYLTNLWKWFLDRFNPVKLLAGIGGVGKTALAREFCEQVARAAPFGFQKIVWLSAKRQFYSAINGRYVPSSRIDFDNVDGLLRQICLELGFLDDEVPSDFTREQLMDAAISALKTIPALVVVDDIDTLEPEQQQDLFHTLIAVFSQTVGKSPVGSRALLTARLDLGAAPGQVVRVKGLEFDEFVDFVHMTCAALELSFPLERSSKRIERFHRVTEGSPTFASSILRLVAIGESIDQAMTKWEKSDGEEVRGFAFQRELEQLADSATNVLYALCILSDSNLLELSTVLTRTEQQVRDDFAELRKYHLISHAEAHLPGGARISVPSSIRMMRDILKSKVRDPRRIETNCAKARSSAGKIIRDIGPHITRIVALWANDHAQDALDLTEMLDRQHPDEPDLKCLLGRAHLRVASPNFKNAELAFRKAQELGCRRPELLPLWVETKAELGDWTGLLDITKFTDKDIPPPEILLARTDAYKRLAEIERRGGNVRSAAERYLEGGKEIDRIFRLRKAAGAVLELKQLRKEFLFTYFDLIDRLTAKPDEYIDVWLAAIYCFDSFVRSPRVLRRGTIRLRDWWRAVEQRSEVSDKSAAVMNVQLSKLRGIVLSLRGQETPDNLLITELEDAVNELDVRVSNYVTLMGET